MSPTNPPLICFWSPKSPDIPSLPWSMCSKASKMVRFLLSARQIQPLPRHQASAPDHTCSDNFGGGSDCELLFGLESKQATLKNYRCHSHVQKSAIRGEQVVLKLRLPSLVFDGRQFRLSIGRLQQSRPNVSSPKRYGTLSERAFQ